MSPAPTTTSRRRRACAAALAVGLAGGLAACTNSSPEEASDDKPAVTGKNDAQGKKVTIAFSAPAADHGWMGAITSAAEAAAKKYPDVTFKVAEGTNDSSLQISQVETFINSKVDAIVLLPFDGAALTPVAQKAMSKGIPVINVDRTFSNPAAARSTVLGDNYGMGSSAGDYVCAQAKGDKKAVVAEIAGIDSLPLTQDRTKGFTDALKECGLKVSKRTTGDFTVEGGEKAASNLLQAAPKIDFLWNHDDDQGVGVLTAIKQAGRTEMTMLGGGGSKNMMQEIKTDKSVVKATVIYPASQGADGVKLARLIAQGKPLSDLVDVEVPREIKLSAPVVTKKNVDEYMGSAYAS